MITIVGYRSETESLSGMIKESTRGARGYSAYEIAVQEGYVGTEEEWLASLKGDPGDPGEPGEPGEPGKDGSSVTVATEQTEDGCEITFTDAEGEHTVELYNGQPGYTPQKGVDYFDGTDGVSPQASVQQTASGAIVTVTDASGTSTAEIANGSDGVSPQASVQQTSSGAIVTVEDASGTTTATLYNGESGVSPTISVTEITDGHRVSITDAEGTQTFDVMDGQDGHGEDGSSAYASVSKSGKVATITLTDKNGTTTAQVSDGEDGQDGNTPERGVDYWTASDKAEIVSDVEDALEDTIDQASVSYSAVTPTDTIQWEQGMINTSTGADASGTTRMRTVGYIPVWGGATIETSKPSSGGIVPIFYHADKSYHYCPSKSKYLSSYTVPEKTYKYMRVMLKMDGSNDALTVADAEANVTIKCGVLQYERSLLKGKTLIFTGDSIPQGQISGGTVAVPYPQIVALQLGMTLKNYSIGATTIASKDNYGGAFATVEEFNAATKDTSLYYQVIDGQDYTTYKYSSGAWTTTSTQVRTPLCERFDLMDDDGDVIVVAAGTNDFQYSWTDAGDMSSRSNHTFYGAMHNICLGLLEKYFKKQIIFCTPLKRAQSPYTSQTDVNENGLTLKDYCNIIKEVCDFYSIPVIDLNSESGLNPELSIHASLFDNVSTHPLQPAHNMLGLMMTERIRACGGNRGIDGKDGHTPVKGTDYWTAQDQQDIVDDVVEEVTKTVTVTGTTPTITGVANTRYVCGEVSTLSITPPVSGIIDVLFTSGSSVALLTVTPPVGETMRWPSGFDPTSLETNTVYEISIMDGVYGLYASWEVTT